MGLPPSLIAGTSAGEAAVHDLMLAMAFCTEGCVERHCDGETEVVFLRFMDDGGRFGGTVPGSFCARHVPTRTRLRKTGTFLAHALSASLPLMAGQVVTEMKAGVGI